MTIRHLYTVIGIEYEFLDFLNLAKSLTLISEQDYKEYVNPDSETNGYYDLRENIKFGDDLKFFQLTHDLTEEYPKPEGYKIVLGLLISKRDISYNKDKYANCDDNKFELEEIIDKYSTCKLLLEKANIKFDRKDIKMYLLQDDCGCCS